MANFWLMKSEPSVYSIDDLARDKKTLWECVRNYRARNYMMKEMKVGDEFIFYHSNAEPPCAAGIGTISSEAQPDPTALNKKSEYYEPKATKENPIWFCVEVKFKEKFARPIPLSEIRENKKLAKMPLLKNGNRLSIQPVGKEEFALIKKLGSDA